MKREYTTEELLDVMGSYLRQISNWGEEYPEVVLSDIKSSIRFVLKINGYDGKYKDELTK